MEVYKIGSIGDKVKQIQKALCINPDGIFGKNTETAVKKFQKENGLYADGIVGKKTLDKLMNNLDSDLSNIMPIENSIKLEKYFLNKDEYFTGNYKNDCIMIHHTAGHDNPKQVVDFWNKDKLGKVGVEFIIGGQNSNTCRDTYDGQIIKAFPDGCQAYHIGGSGSSHMTLHTTGIELCNIGWSKLGKSYTGSKIDPSQLVETKYFRGYTQWHKYSNKQLESLRNLLLHLSVRDNIDLHEGLYKWIKEEGYKAFEFHSDAYYGRINGIITHANVRKDKFDVSPQDNLMDMILSL